LLLLANWRWGVVGAGLTLINPHGLEVWSLVIGYSMGADVRHFIHLRVMEWRPLDLTEPLNILRIIPLLLPGFLFIYQKQLKSTLLWIIVCIMAFKHQRFVDIAGIILAAPLANSLAQLLPQRPMPAPFRFCAIVLVILIAVVPKPGIDQNMYPPDLPFEELAQRKVWNDFQLGGYLGYKGVPVFWDSRNDCYPIEVFQDGMAIEWQESGWRERLTAWRIDTVVTARSALAAVLEKEGWSIRGRFAQIIVLYRNKTEN
jgi:hypothetical protein